MLDPFPCIVVLAGVVIGAMGPAGAQPSHSAAPELPRIALEQASSGGLGLEIQRPFSAAELVIRRIGR